VGALCSKLQFPLNSAKRRAFIAIRMLQGSAGCDPLRVLACDRCDPVVIFVVMPQDGAREFGRRRDDQVRDLHAAVMQTANVSKLMLDLTCASEGFGVDRDSGQAVEFIGECVVVGRGPRRVKNLQPHLVAEGDLIGRQGR
jgi:hypothetical protein